ncbi:SAM-dependent methyltransferase [Actinoplanes sp. TBRC 11911]|uniref:SAM-dependent methyltransferase n=1 Tax=Actinoplanes sp. TBRC 11911 TaxID=2729386 RepID=UPI00145E5C94|nr:SAM-dependent methyltransferase [Actinoplanes sp. TBRC 11911]NMO53904.1 SAM-dependent methyltransferase [Actinoplanes sp. TBRC 11911]
MEAHLSKLDETTPHSARVWNYFLGGTDNFAVDRQVGDQVMRMLPNIVDQARADRAFLGRAVAHLAGDLGVRQFLDVGTGLPTADNTHQVAQRVAPESRIVYVDNDPLVLEQAQALLTSDPAGVTDYLHADLADPDTILRDAARTLDFRQPVALVLMGVLHHVPDTAAAYEIVDRLKDRLAPGSYLVINHATNAVLGAASDEAVAHYNQFGKPTITLRPPAEIIRFFDGWELLEPGVVSCSRWRPGAVDLDSDEVDEFGGMAHKGSS